MLQNPKYNPLPTNRLEAGPRELPITPTDIRQLAHAHGEVVAENVRIMVQEQKIQGGVDPNAVQAAFPEGPQGRLDENELLRMITSFAIWSETTPLH